MINIKSKVITIIISLAIIIGVPVVINGKETKDFYKTKYFELLEQQNEILNMVNDALVKLGEEPITE